jgi:hypothetical protein
MDYVDSPEERAKNPEARGMITRICNGNQDAETFLWRFWNFMHAFDDAIDRDFPVDGAKVTRELMKFLVEIAFNPFFQRHKESLMSMMVMVANRNIVGDEWAKSADPHVKACSQAVRCGDLDLYAHIAFLCGGWDFMREIDHEMRTLDIN